MSRRFPPSRGGFHACRDIVPAHPPEGKLSLRRLAGKSCRCQLTRRPVWIFCVRNMTSNTQEKSNSPAERLFLPFLLLLFFGSGCAALIYEIVWFQMLQLVIGSSAVSLGVLLGTYMGGMCLGSLALARIVSRQRHPLRVYALLELGIGLLGILILYGLPQAAWIY